MDVLPTGGTVRASWSEEVRIQGRKIYVSTAVERTVQPGEGVVKAMGDLRLAISYSHTANIEAATDYVEE